MKSTTRETPSRSYSAAAQTPSVFGYPMPAGSSGRFREASGARADAQRMPNGDPSTLVLWGAEDVRQESRR